MDFENACLGQNWDSSEKEHPKGVDRYLDVDWATMIKSQDFPYRLGVTLMGVTVQLISCYLV